MSWLWAGHPVLAWVLGAPIGDLLGTAIMFFIFERFGLHAFYYGKEERFGRGRFILRHTIDRNDEIIASVLHVVNAIDGISYRASVIKIRKYVTYLSQGLFDQMEKRTSSITTEVAIGKSGSFWSAIFPSLMVGYISNLPPDLDHEEFCDFIKEMLFISDMASLRGMKECGLFNDLCDRRGLRHFSGIRFHLLSRRPIPHVFILE